MAPGDPPRTEEEYHRGIERRQYTTTYAYLRAIRDPIETVVVARRVE